MYGKLAAGPGGAWNRVPRAACPPVPALAGELPVARTRLNEKGGRTNPGVCLACRKGIGEEEVGAEEFDEVLAALGAGGGEAAEDLPGTLAALGLVAAESLRTMTTGRRARSARLLVASTLG